MDNGLQLSEKWIKAYIMATIWASSEIIPESFLHNTKYGTTDNNVHPSNSLQLIHAL